MNNNISNNRLLVNKVKEQSLPYWLKALICKTVGYFNGDLYRFALNSSNELFLTLEHKTTTRLITIVSRAYYSEIAKNYPVENNSELKKLLSLEYGLSNNTFYHVWGGSKGQNQVNIWQFFSKTPDSLIKLPETLVLSQLLNNSEVMLSNSVSDKDTSLYIARNQQSIHSALQTPIVNSVTRFSMAAGLPMVEGEVLLAKNEKPQQLANGLMKVKLNTLFSFIKKVDGKNSLPLLKKVMLPIAAASFIYLLATSTFLLYKQGILEEQLNEKSSLVSSALQQQQAFDHDFSRYQALKQFANTQKIRSGLWIIMADVFSKAKITNVRTVDERYVIRGSVDKATDLLEHISNHANVKNSKFDFPIRKGRGVEVFVISFELSNILSIDNKAASKELLISAKESTNG